MFLIYVENITGDIVRVMTWTGRKEDGIAMVLIESKQKNIPVRRIWAETVKTNNLTTA